MLVKRPHAKPDPTRRGRYQQDLRVVPEVVDGTGQRVDQLLQDQRRDTAEFDVRSEHAFLLVFNVPGVCTYTHAYKFFI